MRFTPLSVHGACLIEPRFFEDDRGSFARTFCTAEMAAAGLDFSVVQTSLSCNPRRGTLRGLHLQIEPHGERKLVSCSRGSIFDVIVDLRPQSPTFRSWFGAVLDSRTRACLYIPKGCAHGFLTLEDDSDVSYAMADPYVPETARGVRWDDPAFGIVWPEAPRLISERDRTYPDFL